MNDQQKVQGIDPSEKEFINGAWVDVKLCTVKEKKLKQNLPDNINKEINSPGISSATSHYNELHYGNYE